MIANRTVREWKARHKSDYEDFKRHVADIGAAQFPVPPFFYSAGA